MLLARYNSRAPSVLAATRQGAAALESVKSRGRFRPEHWIWSGQLRQGLAQPAAFVRSRKRLYDEATDASRNFKE